MRKIRLALGALVAAPAITLLTLGLFLYWAAIEVRGGGGAGKFFLALDAFSDALQ